MKGRSPDGPCLLLQGTRVKALRSLVEGFHRLLQLPPVCLVQHGDYDFSILTAVSQTLRFCSTVARLRQAGGE
jgi:hypothetical protein